MRGPDVGPAGGARRRGARRRSGRGSASCWISVSRSSKSCAQRGPAVHDEEDVAVRVVGAAGGARRPVGGDRVDALRAEVGLAAVDDRRAPRRRSGARRRGSARVPTPPTCGRSASGAEACRRRSRARRTATPAAWSVSDMLATIVRSSVLLPLRGPPTTATWPPAPLRSTVRMSRRCSRGRSTMPRGTTSPPRPRHCGGDQAELRVGGEVGHQVVERVRARRAAAARPGGPAGRGPSMLAYGDRRAATRCSPGRGSTTTGSGSGSGSVERAAPRRS